MNICCKIHAKAEVMLNKAFKVSMFPLSRQNILSVAQHKAEMPLGKWWLLSRLGYGNVFLHTIWVLFVVFGGEIFKNSKWTIDWVEAVFRAELAVARDDEKDASTTVDEEEEEEEEGDGETEEEEEEEKEVGDVEEALLRRSSSL